MGEECRHKCNTIDIIEYEKCNPKTNENVKVREGKCDICVRTKIQIFTQ